MHVVVLEDLGNFFSWSTADRNFVVVDQGEVCARDRLAAADHGPSNTSFSPGFCIFELLFIDRRLRSVVAHTYDFVPASGRRLKCSIRPIITSVGIGLAQPPRFFLRMRH